MKAVLRTQGMLIYFQGGKQGAQVRSPRSGECTWLDLGFRPGEPRAIDWVSEKLTLLSVIFDARGRITGMDIKGWRREQLKYLSNKIRNGEIFQVHAYQDTCGKGVKCPFLTVMKVGP